jgi:hypothetical protein
LEHLSTEEEQKLAQSDINSYRILNRNCTVAWSFTGSCRVDINELVNRYLAIEISRVVKGEGEPVRSDEPHNGLLSNHAMRRTVLQQAAPAAQAG